MPVFEKSFLEEFMPASATSAPVAKNLKPSKTNPDNVRYYRKCL